MNQLNIKNRTIFCHDNLEILQGINSSSIDLIYLDPPFNKKKIFTAPIGSSAEGASFSDIFREEDVKEEWLQTIKEDKDDVYHLLSAVKSIEGNRSYNFCYLAYITIRLMECHRILKDTGSIYLHCDPTMSHYLKLLLDCIFGEKNFRNEVIWSYPQSIKTSKKKELANHDIILCYSKNIDKTYFFPSLIPYNEGQLTRFKHEDEGGKFYYDTRRDKESNKKRVKVYLKKRGTPAGDVWYVNRTQGKEYVGYPTQKPLKLLERIIKASSKENDMVLDPFCGCATTCIAAEKLNRQWIGIDVSIKAYELVKERLQREIANPENIFQYQNIINFHTAPPKRTDDLKDQLKGKYVYVISHKKYRGEYKVGIAANVKNRLNAYQTGDPDRNYELEFACLKSNFRETEKYIHEKFDNKHEWVKGDLKNIIEAIKHY